MGLFGLGCGLNYFRIRGAQYHSRIYRRRAKYHSKLHFEHDYSYRCGSQAKAQPSSGHISHA